MKIQNIIFYPFGLAIYTVLFDVGFSQGQIPLVDAIRPIVVYTVIITILLLVAHRILKDWNLAGYIVISTFIYLFYYGLFYSAARGIGIFHNIQVGQHLFPFLVWTLIIWAPIILSRLFRKKSVRVSSKITKYLNIVIFILLCFPVFTISSYEFNKIHLNPPNNADIQINQTENNNYPDIYYIILDGYGRDDVLKNLYSYDNTSFLDFLRSKGFYVAEQSHSNYTQTLLSLSSSLNLNYLGQLGFTNSYSNNTDRVPLKNLILNSELRAVLEESGYSIVSFDSGFPPTELKDADKYYSRYLGISQLEEVLLSYSIAVLFDGNPGFPFAINGYSTHRSRIDYILDQLKNVPSMAGPKFVFVHILAPHPPFVFDKDGNPVVSNKPFILFDGSTFYGSKKEYIDGYIGQLSYINDQIVKSINALLMESKHKPVIILQGDHGPEAYFNIYSTDDYCLQERVSILNAIYLPDQDTSQLYPSLTPVNTFRVILNKYFGSNLPILEDRIYYSNWDKPYNFKEFDPSSLNPCKATRP